MIGRLAAVVALGLANPAGAEGVCVDPGPWEGAGPVVFQAVDALAPEFFDPSEPPTAAAVELEPDILQTGGAGLAGTAVGALTVEGTAVCIRHRPEWLGLRLENGGDAPAVARVVIATGDGALTARLPEVAGGKHVYVLLRASRPIAGLPASAFELMSAK
ncbi:hypothetical protein [Marimonas arenosa]|uniref:Uncharacterized protein n=1 Tax=Marimonas arenosa TaxID=1795305 RepID=A0AAE3WAX5_9RHOB|nr:hypothetical protein [Marimonas arenosa]MDQ2088457.1 hypothetical protein [Marimonas arenosa]